MNIENKMSASQCTKLGLSELNYFFFYAIKLHSYNVCKKNL